jgi:hypothetical protein
MRKPTSVLVLAIGAATIGISLAPLAGADTGSSCQTVDNTTVCGQGGVRTGGGPPAGASVPAPPTGGGCTNVYGGYQNCNIH